MIDSQADKLKELDKEIRPFRQNWEEADSMKSSVESLQNRVTELESVDKTAGQGARNSGRFYIMQGSKSYELLLWLFENSNTISASL